MDEFAKPRWTLWITICQYIRKFSLIVQAKKPVINSRDLMEEVFSLGGIDINLTGSVFRLQPHYNVDIIDRQQEFWGWCDDLFRFLIYASYNETWQRICGISASLHDTNIYQHSVVAFVLIWRRYSSKCITNRIRESRKTFCHIFAYGKLKDIYMIVSYEKCVSTNIYTISWAR